MKKLTALLLSLCMVLTMACATALAEGKTASATAEGFGGGNVTVTLSVDGDKLVNVEIDATSQTDSIGGAAAKVLAEQMLANNSVEVDGVTAATVTSDAVKAAAAAALAELGLTNADLAKVEAAEKETYTDLTCDVLVIGTGVVALLFIYFSMTPHMSLGDIFATLASGEVKNAAGEWVAGNKLQIVDASWRMDVPYNLMGALVGCTIFKFAQFSTDHEFVQRQLTCKSVKKAGVSLVYSQILSLPIVLIFLSIGLLFYVSYSTSADPAAIMQYKNDARDIFPQYICRSIPTGVRGIMVIGLLAAALSSFNSAINAMASSFVADIYMPLRKRMGHAITSDSDQMSSSKKMVVLMGTVLTGFAIVTAVMQEKSGLNLVDFATGVMSFSYAGMLGVFLCALFTGRGNTRSVVAALVVGLLVVLLLQPYVLGPLSEWLVGRRVNIAWPWWCPIGGVVSFAVCCLGKKKNEK